MVGFTVPLSEEMRGTALQAAMQYPMPGASITIHISLHVKKGGLP